MTSCDTIYHYTTISGLIGIITSRELWASDCQYLNDGTELSYARDIFNTEVEKLKLPPLTDGGYVVSRSSLENFRVFVVCFCEDSDLLSQWRGYGADQGYALGFDATLLQTLDFGEIYPIQYGIPNPSEYFADELSLATQPTAHPGVSEWHASECLLPRLARVKHPSFAEEREWRIFRHKPVYELKTESNGIRFRQSPMGPIAYLTISFPVECLREIVIGPGSHTDTRKAAVHDMLQYQGFQDVNIRVSNIPFRR